MEASTNPTQRLQWHHCFCVQVGSYTNFFADALLAEAELDSRVIGIHAAMGGGTGMNRFERRFPERTFDVGIAEQVRGSCPQTKARLGQPLISSCAGLPCSR